ncbi:MAG: hypothetical protein FRX48_08814 [Lasallia pustulata]|uniref:Uncharacterized protein n=1 Tax=Lasallia pustulata TaxID=136370 RepID=A0A5M8PE42_9LECA|nr:MAG: hypothetical protein FRX48_08814 [Lasallia pustulata]
MVDHRLSIFCSLPREIRDLIYGHLLIKKLTSRGTNALVEALCQSDSRVDGEYRSILDFIDREVELDQHRSGMDCQRRSWPPTVRFKMKRLLFSTDEIAFNGLSSATPIQRS